jgi:hypothetical protein
VTMEINDIEVQLRDRLDALGLPAPNFSRS